MKDHEDRCKQKVEEAYRRAERHYGRNFLRPTITFKKMGVTAGFARFDLNTIDLNTLLLEGQPEDFIARTPAHEAAHIIAYTVYGEAGKGHGSKWKEVMAVLGQEASRCHAYDVSTALAAKGGAFEYRCSCKTTHFSSRRHNNVQKRGMTYVCRSCHKTLRFTGNVKKVEK